MTDLSGCLAVLLLPPDAVGGGLFLETLMDFEDFVGYNLVLRTMYLDIDIIKGSGSHV